MKHFRTRNSIILFFGIALLIIVAIASTSCTKQDDAPTYDFIFIGDNIEGGSVVYDNQTGVMYFYAYKGSLTPLYNPDGSLRVYSEYSSTQLSVANPYPHAAVVVEVDDVGDCVYASDYNGEVWMFYGAEDWMIGDIAAMIIDDCGTPEVAGDKIVSVRYCGSIAVG